MKIPAPLFLFLMTAPALPAALEWDRKTVSVEIQAGQREVEVEFPFKNTGAEPVRITAARASRPSLSLSQITGEYQPGEAGLLKATHAVGNRTGTIMGRITIQTSDPGAPSHDLRVTVYIPPAYRIEPDVVFWAPGAPATGRDVWFSDLSRKGMRPVMVYSTDANFAVSLIPRDDSDRQLIRIQPVSTGQPGGAYIYVDVDIGNGKIEKARILAAVKEPGKKIRMN
jgi:hypothetical protein